ncbi:MAG TPA: acylphosphatase [Epsilonproteobacteria bacterium]|nr:acylphosphatase [Campylobacterota bacterium]
MELYKFIIFGRVQGVFYRKSVSQAAMRRQIRGYVKNLPDGRVEVIAELVEDDLEAFLDLLREGSPLSRVDDISYEQIDDADLIYDGFEIRY